MIDAGHDECKDVTELFTLKRLVSCDVNVISVKTTASSALSRAWNNPLGVRAEEVPRPIVGGRARSHSQSVCPAFVGTRINFH